MKYVLFAYGCVVSVAIVGCGRAPAKQETHEPVTTVIAEPTVEIDAQRLRQKANDLAMSELSRMSAAALIYRNLPEFHPIESDLFAPGFGAYVKMFRRFHSHKIKDIRASNSLINPIEIDIQYFYDVFATPEHTSIEENALEKCRNEKEYSPILSDQFQRTYLCDKDGNLIGDLPELPARPTYWDRGRYNAGLTKLSTGAMPSVPVYPGETPHKPADSAAPGIPQQPQGQPGTGQLVPLDSLEGILPPGLTPPVPQ